MRLIIAAVFSTVLLSACGYQGPLYLPDPNAAPKQSQVPATPLVPATPTADAAADASATTATQPE
ncbi:MAG: lipoprotein [Neisseriaceae bacterium]|nr:lipoprotein [Neisseriaceae bacterium]